ncbi:MAG: hypothetical protein P4L42_02660 [Desulfocapsaceae bacterium]|nr:hypothetical protein [Desulfocapsaceae bacterium]
MKKIAIACILVVASVSVALADWLGEFRDIYVTGGIDKAVEQAMKGGANPELIVENGLQLEGLNPQNLIKALYCAGAKGQDIRAAAEKADISELIVAAGYKKSIAECGDRFADAQAYTPVPEDIAFSAPPTVPTTAVSPSTF